MQIRYSATTHVGLRRKINEDSILTLPDQRIWVVSDGMGGHDNGDYASQAVVDRIAMIPTDLTPAEKLRALRDAIGQANDQIFRIRREKAGDDRGDCCLLSCGGRLFCGLLVWR